MQQDRQHWITSVWGGNCEFERRVIGAIQTQNSNSSGFVGWRTGNSPDPTGSTPVVHGLLHHLKSISPGTGRPWLDSIAVMAPDATVSGTVRDSSSMVLTRRLSMAPVSAGPFGSITSFHFAVQKIQ